MCVVVGGGGGGVYKICSCVISAKDEQTTNLHEHLCVCHAEVNRNYDKQNITEHRAGL